MINKETKMLTLFIILLNAATVAGYVLAEKPSTPDQIMPYIDPGLKIMTHEWARDQALVYLDLEPTELWVQSNMTPADVLGTSVFLFESGELSVNVIHCLNPTADYFVDVTYLGQSWSLRVSQMGECTLIN
ncbi:hypothetical protein IH574_01310 [Candidatus Bathyarchaeota archaeon]|nr:hypothetical protein [Candidatus Bathyarchaeota archaeon]